MEINQIIIPPAQAAFATLTLHRWRARDVSLAAPLEITAYEPQAGTPPDNAANRKHTDWLLWQKTAPAVPAETYELHAIFDRALSKRDIVATIRFTDADGVECAPGAPILKSDRVGYFQYLAPVDATFSAASRKTHADGTAGFAKFKAPPNAVRLKACLLRWSHIPPDALESATLIPRADRVDLLAQGLIDVPYTQDAKALTLNAHLRVGGPEPILMDLSFLDTAGEPLKATGRPLSHHTEFDTFLRLTAPPLSRHDGLLPVHVPLPLPEGTQALRWAVFLPDGGDHSLHETPSLAASPPAHGIQPKTEINTALYDDLITIAGTPTYHAHAAHHGFDLLASAALALEPSAASLEEGWHLLDLDLAREAGGLAHANIVLCATYFDADKQVLAAQPLSGFALSDDFGLHCSLTVTPLDTYGNTGQTRAPLPVPEGASFALFDVIACHPDSQITTNALVLEPIEAAEACRALDVMRMSRPQLIKALDIAETTGDLNARHAILSALSVVDPQTKGYAYRSRILAETLEVHAQGWLPEVGPIPAPTARYQSLSDVFHLAADPFGGPHSVMAQQASHGLRPVWANGFDSAPDRPLPAGVVDTAFVLPKDGASEMSYGNRLSLEARAHGKVLRAARSGVIHVTTDFANADMALVGAALARAHGLPLVLDLVTLTHAQADPVLIDRCLRAADRIVLATQTDRTASCLTAALQDRIDIIPPALDPTFETPVPRAALTSLRAAQGLNLQKTIGYYGPRDGNPLETLAPVAQMPSPPTIILLGPGSLHHALQLRAAGLHVLCPDENERSAGDMPVWYRLCLSVIIEAGTLPLTLLETALKAVSQGCRTLLPDGPDARAFAGPNEARAGLFAPDRADAVAEALTAQGAHTQEHQNAAQHWLRSERLWAHRIAAYHVTYRAAQDQLLRDRAS